MQIGALQNGLKRKKRARRRNPAPTASKTKSAKRNPSPVTAARAAAYAKRNGMKLVARGTSANPKKKRRSRRNGVVTTTSKRNGLLGSSRSDAEKVIALGAGAVLTRLIGRTVNGFVAPLASQMGLGRFSGVIVEGAVALTAIPWLGKKIRNNAAGDFARLGGLLAAGFSAAETFAPGVIPNPFASGDSLLVTPAAVAQIAAGVAASPNPAATAAKVGAWAQLSSGQGYREENGGYIEEAPTFADNAMFVA